MIFSTAARWLTRQVSSLDIYGKTITFTYKGKEKYNTFIGGMTTLAIMSVMLVYAIRLLLIVINRKDTNSSINTTINNLNNDSKLLNLENTTFEFGIFISYNISNNQVIFETDNSLFTLSMVQHYESSQQAIQGKAIELSK